MTVSRLLLRPVATATAAVFLLAVPVVPVAAQAAKPVASPPGKLNPAGKPDSAGVEFFERKVRPVLAEHCYSCHSAKAEKLKGNLYLDSRDGVLKGGDSGPAVLPGSPNKSPLVKAVRWEDQDTKMPPKTQLPPQVVADLTRWVQMGAPWPAEKKVAGAVGAAGPTAVKPGETQDQKWAELKRDHWAWQPVKAAPPPAVKDGSWPRSDVDHFVLAKLEAANLKPVSDADRATLLRRVTFDLVGLPPTPEEIAAFVADKSPTAFEQVVDRLLASSRFGEKWGRHWLDIARYAETTGSTRNYPYHHAWRYRDYVIDSVNADKPYNTFVMEQVAGDLMPAKDASQRNERLVATGLLAMGVKDLNERDREKFAMDNVDEQIDTVSRAVLATTIACARCHDHKFDPIPTEEYYQLAGIFRSTDILAGITNKRGGQGRDYKDENALIRLSPVGSVASPAAGGDSRGGAVAARAPAGEKAAPATKADRLAALNAQLEDAQIEMRKMALALGVRPGDPDKVRKVLKENPAKAREVLAKRNEVQELRAAIAAAEKDSGPAADAPASGAAAANRKKKLQQRPNADGPPAGPAAADAPLAIGVRDAARPADARVNIRGDHDNLGPAVPRGFISLVKVPSAPAVKPDESGRMQLALWLTAAENPLTSRVMVNRVWHHLFGQGLVRTVDNFGTTGEAPSHPQLLDHLAARFVRDGWSVKKTIRSIVLSRTYQLAATYDAKCYATDPANLLLWRHGQKRLEAEQIRDAMLAIGGNLDLARPAASPVAKLPDVEIREGRRGATFDRGGGEHRSVYIPVMRALLNPMMDTFDLADPAMVTGQRDVTTVATQALFMMNNAFAAGQARRLAERVLADSSLGNDAGRIDEAYRWALGRPATAAEQKRAADYLAAFAAEAGPGDPAKAKLDAWASYVQALVASAEFRYLN